MKATGERAGKGVGGSAPREVKVSRGDASGDFTGLTKADVNKVIKAASGGFRACYQDALNRSPDLAGKVVVRFVIKDDGTGPRGAGVTRASLDRGGSTIGNSAVENCVVGKIKSLRFPPRAAPSSTIRSSLEWGGGRMSPRQAWSDRRLALAAACANDPQYIGSPGPIDSDPAAAGRDHHVTLPVRAEKLAQ